jgi:hypothetical protein
VKTEGGGVGVVPQLQKVHSVLQKTQTLSVRLLGHLSSLILIKTLI